MQRSSSNFTQANAPIKQNLTLPNQTQLIEQPRAGLSRRNVNRMSASLTSKAPNRSLRTSSLHREAQRRQTIVAYQASPITFVHRLLSEGLSTAESMVTIPPRQMETGTLVTKTPLVKVQAVKPAPEKPQYSIKQALNLQGLKAQPVQSLSKASLSKAKAPTPEAV